MIPADIRLYTWLDVEDVLVRKIQGEAGWPDWLVDARTYWDGLAVRVRQGQVPAATLWLRDALDPRVTTDEHGSTFDLRVLLETSNGARVLPIRFEEVVEQVSLATPIPTLSRPGLIQKGSADVLRPSAFPDGSPALIAFHSFKGGVGRTLHALALATRLAEAKGSVLLVDADFEAPGITWLLESRLPNPPIAFSDLLALVHGDVDPTASEALEIVSQRLQDAHLGSIYVLPAFRSTRSLQSLDIRPEHLLQGREDPFVLSNVLVSLGKRLSADVIIVDLRAGLSELSAGLLLDPRVQRIFVTTLSGQSLNGTELVLDLVARRAPSLEDGHPLPNVLINEVPADLRDTTTLGEVEERLFAAVSKTFNRVSEPVSSELLRGPSWFDPSLIALSSNWDDVLEILARSQILQSVEPIAKVVPVRGDDRASISAADSDVINTRQALANTAERVIFAETSAGADFLPISPLRRLVEDHRAQVPNVVVVGAKGAGKTYTFLQLMSRGEWSTFVRDAGANKVSIDATLFPFLQPLNVSASASSVLNAARNQVSSALGLAAPLTYFDVLDRIQGWLKKDLHEGEWRERWLDLVAWSAGFEIDSPGAGRRLSDHLRSGESRVLLVVDGLEDLFQNIASSEPEQRAVRALIQEVPNWLEQLPDRKLGILIFIRRDMVAAAVRQNSAQLIARYEPYALRWDRAEALRLVLWITSKAGIHPEVPPSRMREMNQEELVEELVPVWGRKLGQDTSREGRSAEWVIAALSDFRGQIQARDVVRFLHVAAKRSMGATQWPDRILTPVAVRDAVADCSVEKILEIEQENPTLGKLFDKLRGLDASYRSIPFRAEDVRLDAGELLLLELNGVVVADEGAYYMPEIFRRGLDFRLPLGARPKVLALARRRQI